MDRPGETQFSRRRFLRGAAIGGAAIATGNVMAEDPAFANTHHAIKEKATYGGQLKIGMVSGGATETLDPNAVVYNIDIARCQNLFDRLVRLGPSLGVEYELAESFEPNRDATEWTVRLRHGVTWHNGKPLSVEDVIYTLQRIAAPKSTLSGKNVTSLIHLKSIKKVDNLTLKLPLVTPVSELPALFTAIYMGIVQDGEANPMHHPIGTGPFKYVSFTPGESSVFTKFKNYWKRGLPYVDSLEIISIVDSTTRLDALLSGQVDAVDALPFVDARAQMHGGQINVLEGISPNMMAIVMNTHLHPFQDVRVRQAMRLLANRPGLLKSAQLGFGTIGNDLFGKGLVDYDSAIAQRTQDVDQAKYLLKKAGQEKTTFTLVSGEASPGMVESATAFSEQAAKAGVKIQVDVIPASQYYGPTWLSRPFGQTHWAVIPIVSFISQALGANAPFNETHWIDARFNALFLDAQRTVNASKRQMYYDEMQQILWNDGGYLVWGFQPFLDGVSKAVHGVQNDPSNELGDFRFHTWWK